MKNIDILCFKPKYWCEDTSLKIIGWIEKDEKISDEYILKIFREKINDDYETIEEIKKEYDIYIEKN